MALTTTFLSATPERLKYSVVSNGAGGGVATSTIASATLITNSAAGPLRNALSASYASQALMRTVFGSGPVDLRTQGRTLGGAAGSTASVDVDVDAVTATRPEVNVIVLDTVVSEVIVTIEFKHSSIR